MVAGTKQKAAGPKPSGFLQKCRKLALVMRKKQGAEGVQPSRSWWSSLENMMVWLE